VLASGAGHPYLGISFALLAVSEPDRALAPASLQWQKDGELSPQDVFNLVCRLRQVEPGEHSNDLWRLSHKYPSTDQKCVDVD